MGIGFRSAALAASVALASGAVFAQDFLGAFKGTEKVTVSRCGSYDGVITGNWEVTHAPLEGGAYKITGSTARGSFTGTGKPDGSTSAATVEGFDPPSSRWRAKSQSTIDGDKLVVSSSGEVLGTTCLFVVEAEATRVR